MWRSAIISPDPNGKDIGWEAEVATYSEAAGDTWIDGQELPESLKDSPRQGLEASLSG